jgi:outer membrane lipoprotein-sorting protein
MSAGAPRLHRRSLPALALLIACAPVASLAASTPPLAGIMADLAAMPNRRADFTEEKRLSSLTTPLISQGQLLYRRPSYLEKITLSPKPERLIVSGETLIIQSGSAPARQIDLSDHPIVQAMVDTIRGTIAGDLATLERYYNITQQGDRAAWHLTMIPTDPRMAKQIKVIEVNGRGIDVQRIRTTQANGDEDLLTIRTIE